MDPRLYKKMIEDGERPKPTAGAGSGLGHVTRGTSNLGQTEEEQHFHEYSEPVQQHWGAYPSGKTVGTEGYEHAHTSGLSGVNPVVNPNFNPPSFTQGAVIPHVSGALGSTNKLGKTNGTKLLYGLGGLALAAATFWGAKKFATRKMLDFDDDMMPEE